MNSNSKKDPLKRGRPFYVDYKALGFELIGPRSAGKNRRYMAFCKVCKKTLKNVADFRLKAHRNKCKLSAENEITSTSMKLPAVFTDARENSLIIIDSDAESTSSDVIMEDQTTLQVFNEDDVAPEDLSHLNIPSTAVPLYRGAQGSSSNTSNDTSVQGGITEFVDTITTKDIDAITLSMAEFFYGCNIPFNLVDSSLFFTIIAKLRPAYISSIPYKELLSTTLLDSAYEKSLQTARSAIGKFSVLLSSVWMNSSNNQTVVCILSDIKTKSSVFVDTWQIDGEQESEGELSEILCEAADISKEIYDTEVYAAVFDNVNMVRTETNQSNGVWQIPCCSQIGKRFLSDIQSSSISSDVAEILKCFTHPELQKELLAKGGTKIELPCLTEWISCRDLNACLLKNLRFFKLVAAGDNENAIKNVKPKVMEQIFDENFIENIQGSLKSLEPVINLINKCLEWKTSIADAVNLWLLLTVETNHLFYYRKRLDMVLNVYSLAAYYLHPYYSNDLMPKTYLANMNLFLVENLSGKGLDELDKFKNREDVFGILYKKDITDPILFWNTAEFNAPELSMLAVKLLKIPAASANITKMFSKWSLIHNSTQNGLSSEGTKKLMHLYVSLGMQAIPNSENTASDNLLYFDLPSVSSNCSSLTLSTHTRGSANTNCGNTKSVDGISTKDIEDITLSIAEFFYGCNIPLKVADSNIFRRFIAKLRPAYICSIPNRELLSTTLLDLAYEKSVEKSRSAIGRLSVLLCSSWKNSSSNTQTVVCTLIDIKTKSSVFVDTWQVAGEQGSDDELSEILCEAADISKEIYDTEVYAAVSDNINMVRMGENQSTELWQIPCSSHIAKLLALDIQAASMSSDVAEILKCFTQPVLERELLRRGGEKIELPCFTKLRSSVELNECFLKNLSFLKIVAAEYGANKKIEPKIMTQIFNENFIQNVRDALESLESVFDLVNKCQDRKTSVADAVNLWLNLAVKNQHLCNYANRLSMVLNTYSLAAYYLHPQYNNDLIPKSYLSKMNMFLIEKLSAKGLDELDKFKNRDHFYDILYTTVTDPLLFWNTAKGYAPELSLLAIKLLEIPASSANLERVFSKWNLIDNSSQNGLSFERTKKLMHLYVSLGMQDITFDEA